ncbi:ThuA domain-containing protein [Daejeonella lutea]|uniref:Glucose/arabinose dehydrogenase, beta-propeller fold n=1 Tax=Daejeonella lutea TaxID=572036 RepID=A0A1T5EZG4_9SPHI|nr:ThuA domain-containing protein [Daejeonella lutea]SKB89323.1 Glucose/arabinose dehydrogenase, beta-propeller fold [Daejeonella lutea]
MRNSTLVLIATGILLSLFSFRLLKQTVKPRILVFSKTAGFRHESIAAGKAAIIKLGKEQGFLVDTTESVSYFTEDSLKKYKAVVFLSTTGNILNAPQQIAFERYIQAGGGYAGVHAAADTEYDWEWYGKLVGGYFLSHPKTQEAVVNVTDRANASTSHLPEKWKRTDEWYNYKTLNPNVRVLASLDESSYEGGKNGSNHPIAWYHQYDGGRAFYTGMGHTKESFDDPLYLKHLLGGIKYAIGNNVVLNYSKATTAKAPEENRFVRTILTQGTLFEPTEMTILPNLDILLVQRRGEIMLYKEQTKTISQIASLDVYSKTSVPGVNAEEGILGLAADPNFKENNYVYIYYSPIDTSVNRLSRFKFVNDKLDKSSEKIILQLYSQREICCHTGGSIAFGPDGLLYLSTGDNSTPFDVPNQQFTNKGFGPMDNRPGLEQYDAGRSSGNTNDLRGKILRIKLKPDGSYEIPAGNLFPPNTPLTRPEIYVMGNRNPYRISIDSKTNFLYWGEVGPDANADSPERGPRGYDELNQARKAGFFGWPYFVGNNYAYRQYDYKTGTSGEPFDKLKPVNNSPNNTGLKELPSVEPAFIWYPYAESKEFPQLGTGGRNAEAGPVYHSELYPKETRYPAYYDNKLFMYDWIRGWVKAVTMHPNGDYDNMEPFMGSSPFIAPIDMEVGPDGRLYVLEYGKGWFTQNPDAGLIRIDYISGNRPPKVDDLVITNTSGTMPYKLQAKVIASDPDNDALSYVWDLGNGTKKTTIQPSIEYVYPKAGEFPVSVEVIDKTKASTSSVKKNVFAGNSRPKLNVALKGNKTFYFPGKPISYEILVTDQGSNVNRSKIYVASNYTKGTDMAGAALGHQEVPDVQIGEGLMLKSDCSACHKVNAVSVGPSFTAVSNKYQTQANAINYIATKILKGSSGVWGEVAMPAHATMPESDAQKIAQYVLSLGSKSSSKPSLPAQGQIIPESGSEENNTFVINASYTDAGSAGVNPLTGTGAAYLRSNVINAREITQRARLALKDSTSTGLIAYPQNDGWIKLKGIDLTGIGSIDLSSLNGNEAGSYSVEVRLDQENGKLIGSSEINSGGTQKQLNSLINLQSAGDSKFHDLYIIVKSNNAIRRRPFLQSIKFNSI